MSRPFLFIETKEGQKRVRCDVDDGAAKAILDRLAPAKPQKVFPNNSSPGNRADARAKKVEGDTRILKLDLEMRCRVRLTANDAFWTLWCRHASWLLTRCRRRVCGQTPHKCLARRGKGTVARGGEAVPFRILHPQTPTHCTELNAAE